MHCVARRVQVLVKKKHLKFSCNVMNKMQELCSASYARQIHNKMYSGQNYNGVSCSFFNIYRLLLNLKVLLSVNIVLYVYYR